MISLRDISKSFGPVVAIDRASLELGPGEIVALVGENGAGKTSLMNVLYGLYQPDAGEIWIEGERVRLRGPRAAIERGIGMVHQHFMLVPNLTVAENVVLGHEPRRRGLLDLDAAVAQVEQTCSRFGFKLDPRAMVGDLGVSSQQKVEIVKALHRGARVLILDEPTAVLTPQESDELFGVARQLAKSGQAVVFISHKLKEVLTVADRIVVMRRGKRVGEVRPAGTTAEQLAAMMVGAEASEALRAEGLGGVETSPEAPAASGPALVELEAAAASGDDGRPVLASATLCVRPGEIVGIAGVDGSGQRELADLVTGLRTPTSGSVRLCGEPFLSPSPSEARRRGVAHVPEDRLLRAVVGPMTVEENVALGRQGDAPFARGPWIDFAGRRERTARLLEDFDVRPRDPTLRFAALSGGNQQKAVLAREIDTSPRLLVAVQPTRGLDIGAVAAVHKRLRAERARGAGVLLVSFELDEILALSDRLYVLYAGRTVGEVPRAEFDERRIGRLMLGARAEEVAHA